MKLTPSEERQIRAQRAIIAERAKFGRGVFDALLVAEQYVTWRDDETDEQLHPGSDAIAEALVTLAACVRARNP